jgi:hypothetical protein
MLLAVLDVYILIKFKFHIAWRLFMQWLLFGNAELLRSALVLFLQLINRCVVLEALYIEKGHAIEFTKQMNILLFLESENGFLNVERFKAQSYEISFTLSNGIKNNIKVEDGIDDRVAFTF